jgi:hypothetical protein
MLPLLNVSTSYYYCAIPLYSRLADAVLLLDFGSAPGRRADKPKIIPRRPILVSPSRAPLLSVGSRFDKFIPVFTRDY